MHTYLGQDAGERVRLGAVQRGDRTSLRAVVWFADIRDYTSLSERLSHRDLLGLLNHTFEVVVAAVHARGGQVLKFVGDGVLAVFVDDGAEGATATACRQARAAALDVQSGLTRPRAERGAQALPVAEMGIGLHFGEVINPEQYIQHNPQTHTGREGLAALFSRLSKTSPRVNLVRLFSDGDHVFAHTEYDFSSRRIGFEVFRFEGDQTVEHWDNIQPREGPNPSGHSMVDGPTEATDLPLTEANRELVRGFVTEVLMERRLERLADYLHADGFTQHNPGLEDGPEALRAQLQAATDGAFEVEYARLHRVLAEGSFVLAVSEGTLRGVHTAFYDLFRVAGARLAEHRDTVEAVAPLSEWKNDNGKF